jgi:hypothetical protein
MTRLKTFAVDFESRGGDTQVGEQSTSVLTGLTEKDSGPNQKKVTKQGLLGDLQTLKSSRVNFRSSSLLQPDITDMKVRGEMVSFQ